MIIRLTALVLLAGCVAPSPSVSPVPAGGDIHVTARYNGQSVAAECLFGGPALDARVITPAAIPDTSGVAGGGIIAIKCTYLGVVMLTDAIPAMGFTEIVVDFGRTSGIRFFNASGAKVR